MLDFRPIQLNTWEPPTLPDEIIRETSLTDKLVIFKTTPYIDSIFVSGDTVPVRFTFHPGYCWSYEDERFFTEHVLNNAGIEYTPVLNEIYRFYSQEYPDWKLKRYYTNPMRLFDHIYHCMRRGTVKEMLYKAGLDELAAHIDEMDEVNLLANKPSDIYGGISIRTLRSLNCGEAYLLLGTEEKRKFILKLQSGFPDTFKTPFNGAMCRYLSYLIEGDLTVGEAMRLFGARRNDLLQFWAPAQYEMFIWKEKINREALEVVTRISAIDPIYKEKIGKIDIKDSKELLKKVQLLKHYLCDMREEYDRKIRRSNRRRDQAWMERDNGYVVRYPQTINDFCREAIYMSNCLITYVDAYIENDTTILFMRKPDDFNMPFITIEVFGNKLMQAYHRFNEDCTSEEAEWILDFCDRHGIERGNFSFNVEEDELF